MKTFRATTEEYYVWDCPYCGEEAKCEGTDR